MKVHPSHHFCTHHGVPCRQLALLLVSVDEAVVTKIAGITKLLQVKDTNTVTSARAIGR